MAVDWTSADPRVKRFYVDLVRQWGDRLPLTSAYRSPEHNARVGGAKNSRHMHGDALDIDVSSLSPEQRVQLIQMASQSGAGGIGVYDDSLHFDLGDRRAWGPSYGHESVPEWASGAIQSHLAQNTAQANDATPLTREQWEAEKQRRAKMPLTREQWEAEKAKRAGAEAGDARDPAAMPRAMIADLNAGYQGVNPVSVSKASPLGIVVREGDNAYLDVDGTKTLIKPEDYGKYVTQVDPDTGLELLYKRTPEMEESGLASAGRVLGYGILGGPGGAGVKATAKTPASGKQAEAMQAAKELGITPSLGMTGPGGARAAGAMEGFYTTAGRAVDDAARAADELSGAVARTAGKAGYGSTPFEGGQALLEGAGDFLIKNLKGTDAVPSKSARLFARVDRMIPKGTRIDVSGLTDTLKGFVQRFADAPEIAQSLGQGKWQRWLDDIAKNEGQLTWEQARALRSDIGEAIGKMSGPMTDVAGGELKQLYGALTRDLDAAATAAGPGAASAWKNAVSHYKWASEKVGEALDILFKAKSPEQAYSNFLALGSEAGSRANIRKLLDIKRAIPEEDWANVVGTIIRRMGQATPGAQDAVGEAFSASKFLTDWNKLSPAAKQALFEGKGIPKGLRAELDALAKVMETAKNAAKQTNVSRSGTVMGNLGMAGVAMWEPIAALGAGVMSHITARVLTNPRVLRALRNYIASGGNKRAAQKLLESAGENRELLGDVATIIRLEAPRSSEQPLPARPTGEPLALPR